MTIVDSLRTTITTKVDSKKAWTRVAQWLTVLAPSTSAIKPKKRARVKQCGNNLRNGSNYWHVIPPDGKERHPDKYN